MLIVVNIIYFLVKFMNWYVLLIMFKKNYVFNLFCVIVDRNIDIFFMYLKSECVKINYMYNNICMYLLLEILVILLVFW